MKFIQLDDNLYINTDHIVFIKITAHGAKLTFSNSIAPEFITLEQWEKIKNEEN